VNLSEIKRAMDELVEEAELKAVCLKRKVGAKYYLSPGCSRTDFCSPPKDLGACKNCKREGMQPFEKSELCPAIHAEQRVLLTVSGWLNSRNLEDGVFITTCYPCPLCSLLIIELNIKEFYYREGYAKQQMEITEKWFEKANVKAIQI